MKQFLSDNLKKLLLIPPIVIGGIVLYFAGANQLTPQRVPEKEVSRSLRVIDLEPVNVIPRATGYGESQASREWRVVAEVKGRIIRLHQDLKPGSFIKKDDLLLEIDPTDIQNSIQRLKAEIESSQAKLAELKVSQKNYQESLNIENQKLVVAKQELDRSVGLQKQNAFSQAEVDAKRREHFAQQQAVQNIKSSLNLIPSQIKSAEASISISNANLNDATRDLSRCKIVATFTCRIGPVTLEKGEFVSAGQHLFTTQSVDKIEVEAQFPPASLSRLINNSEAFKQDIKLEGQTRPQETLRKFFNIRAAVRYGSEGIRAERVASFERLRENLEELSRTIGVVVSIAKPYEPTRNSEQRTPPPVIGTFCEVELQGNPIPNSIVIPRNVIRDGQVFIVDSENRLQKRKIEVQWKQQNFAVISSGLSAGDRLIVSDPTPAIVGMLVSPEEDQQLWQEIKKEATRDSFQNMAPNQSSQTPNKKENSLGVSQ